MKRHGSDGININSRYALCVATALSVSAMVTTVSTANAETLPDPSYSGSFIVGAHGYICGSGSCSAQESVSNQAITGPGSLSYSGSAPLISDGSYIPPSNYTPGATASGSFSFSQNPSPSLTMFGTAWTVPVGGASAAVNIGNATLTYSMEITGPTPEVSVQVDARGGVTVSSIAAGGSDNNFAEVIFGIAGELSDRALACTGDGLITNTFDDTKTYTLSTNYQYSIYLYSNLYAGVSGAPGKVGGGTATFSGFIDPTFTVVGNDPGAHCPSVRESAIALGVSRNLPHGR